MLAAMTAFALHSGAMAGLKVHNAAFHHTEGGIQSGASHQTHRDHGGDPALAGAANSCAHWVGLGDPEGADATLISHCGNVCGLGLPSIGPGVPACTMTANTLALVSQEGTGIDPTGPKRPPRTPCIG
jgi:hypothetical protein